MSGIPHEPGCDGNSPADPAGRWQKLSAWFNEWLAAAEPERARLRARLAADHPALVAEADDLVRSSGQLDEFLETPALVLAARTLAREDLLLPPQSMVGPYRVVNLIARGGMGDVYRATDTRLQRDVAVKVLADERTEDRQRLDRFMQEARVTASLDHPNVVRVYDVGRFGERTYLVAELLDGETLRARIERGPLPVEETLRIARQTVSGLSAAHAAGLVHRDLKPENIFVTRSGNVKILDFGIAKLTQDETVGEGFSTLTGVVLGTAGYLAPEQIRGQRVDAAADLFAVGVVLFEALTGRRAFAREHLVETLYAILHESPSDALAARQDVPPELTAIIMRLLEKSPAARFASCAELLDALERVEPGSRAIAPLRSPGAAAAGAWIARLSTRRIRTVALACALVVTAVLALSWSIGRTPWTQPSAPSSVTLAVLPFRTIPAARDDLLQAGLAEVLVSRLGQLPDIRVLPLAATERIRSRGTQTVEALGATHVLTGTIQRDRTRVRATVQLLHARDERTLWSAPIDADAFSLFSIQDIIVTRVVDELAPRLAAGRRRGLTDPGTRNNEAYESYLRGRAYVGKTTRAELLRAAAFFSEAVKLDPAFADAWAGLGSAYKRMTIGGDIRPADAFQPAKHAAGRALKLDPDNAEAHSVLGTAAFWYDWDYGSAERLLRRALELHPSAADSQLSLAHLFSNLGRHDEAIEGIRRAQVFDPTWPILRSLEGQFLFMARRYDESLERLDALVQMEPRFPAGHIMRAYPLLALRRYDDALAECQRTTELRKSVDHSEQMYSWAAGLEGYALALAARTADAEQRLDDLRTSARTQYVSPYAEALILLALERHDAALERLQAAVAVRDHRVTFLGVDPKWDPLRGMRAFHDLLVQAKLLDVPGTR